MSMTLRVTGTGRETFPCNHNCGMRRLQWVSEETDTQGTPVRVRTPEPKVTCFEPPHPFTAAGKTYTDLSQLTAEASADGFCRDIHGRRVVELAERFPCFDSWDYAHEDRYFRWWVILLPESITLVYTEDRSGKLWVNDDVLDLNRKCTEALEVLKIII